MQLIQQFHRGFYEVPAKVIKEADYTIVVSDLMSLGIHQLFVLSSRSNDDAIMQLVNKLFNA